MEQVIADRNKEIGVLEIKQQAQVENNAADQQRFLFYFIRLPENGIGQNKIDNGRKNDQPYKITTGLIKKIKGEKTKDITAHFKVVPETVIQCDENGKKENKEPVIK
jgi:hypothetical protein